MANNNPSTSRYYDTVTVSEVDRILNSDSESEFDESLDEIDDPDNLSSSSESDSEINTSNTSLPQSPQTNIGLPASNRLPSNWIDSPNSMRTFLFNETPGLRVPIPGNSPYDFFKLVVDNAFLQSVVHETNKYATEVFLSEKTTESSRITQWKDTNINELNTFLGLLLHMGVMKLPKINDYWRTDLLFKTCFGKFMARDRFLLILRCLHFAQNDDSVTDRLHKIRNVINYFNSKMWNIYTPGKEFSLDESMLLWRGRLVFKQYIKNKRHKYGIKLYVLTEPNGLIVKFCVYSGAFDELSGQGHTSKVVLYLMEEWLDKGHSIYADNFYNSVELSKNLLQMKTFITGTLRADRKENPVSVTKQKLKRGETVAKYNEGVMVGMWRDKRNVLYISTQYENVMSISTNKRGQEKEKPFPIIRYNEFMKGVDRQDQFLSYYPCERKTLRWYKKLFIHILEMCLQNAYFLYHKNTVGKKFTLLDFRLEVIKKLLPLNEDGVQRPVVAEHLPKKLPVGQNNKTLRRRCVLCNRNGKRKDTIYFCEACQEKPALCLEDCFKTYHQ